MEIITLSKQQVTLIEKVTKHMCASNTVLPILENMHIKNKKIIFNNLSTTVILKNMPINEEFLIGGKNFIDVMKLLPEFTIELEYIARDNDPMQEFPYKVIFASPDKSESMKYQVEDYEEMPLQMNHKAKVLSFDYIDQLDTYDIEKLIQISNFSSKDELRPAMTCVALINGNVVATDAHLCHWLETKFEHTEPVLITRESLALIKLLKDYGDFTVSEWTDVPAPGSNDEEAENARIQDEMNRGETREKATAKVHSQRVRVLRFDNQAATFYVRRMDERYPDYESVIPRDNPYKIQMVTKDLLNVLAKAIKMGNSTTSQVNFDIKDGEVKIWAEDLDFGREYSKVLPITVLKNPIELEIAFNGKFLEKALKLTVKDELFTMEMGLPNRAAVINGNMLVMPIKRDNYN